MPARYGEPWVGGYCRQEVGRRRRYKTVELIEEETGWLPNPAEVVQVRDVDTFEKYVYL